LFGEESFFNLFYQGFYDLHFKFNFNFEENFLKKGALIDGVLYIQTTNLIKNK
jgi:hypothetical protein